MLDTLEQALSNLGVPMTTDALLGANITWSHNISFIVEAKEHGTLFLKAAPETLPDLKREWNGLERARQNCSKNIPKPIGLVSAGGWTFLATRHKDGKNLPSLKMLWTNDTERKSVETAIQNLTDGFDHANNSSARATLLEKAGTMNPALASYLKSDEILEIIRALPCIPQHGDLVPANMIIDRGNNLVIFDWEDFGVVDLPGFDMALLIGSLLNHDARDIMSWFARSDSQDLINKIFSRTGLQFDTFIKLLPVYYGLFCVLKHDHRYREIIQTTAAKTAADLLDLTTKTC